MAHLMQEDRDDQDRNGHHAPEKLSRRLGAEGQHKQTQHQDGAVNLHPDAEGAVKDEKDLIVTEHGQPLTDSAPQ